MARRLKPACAPGGAIGRTRSTEVIRLPETKTTLTKRLAVPVLIAISLAFPVGIAAHTNEQIAKTGGMTVMPLLGVALTVTLDDVGNIETVGFNPAGITQTEAGDHKVKFANADGTVKVDVKAKGSKLSVNARTGSLVDLIGSAVWSADVFGTGTASSVPYEIGSTDGRPTLRIDEPTVPAGVTAVRSPIKTSGNNVSGQVTFEFDGYTKKLSIRVHVDQGVGKASLKITLSGKDKQKLTGALPVGTRTWSAHLCDGTAVGVTFNVNADGTVSFVSATPASPAVKVKTNKHGFKATFEGTKVGVSVKLTQKGEQWTLKVDGKSGKCKHDKDKKAESASKEKKNDPARKDES
jgi:hypothetical protein